jgi:hypothetical protein
MLPILLAAVLMAGLGLFASPPAKAVAGGSTPVVAHQAVSSAKTVATGVRSKTKKKHRKAVTGVRKMAAQPLSARVKLGTWVPGSTTNPAVFDAHEALVGGQLDIVSLFYGYGDWFPSSREEALSAGGRRSVLIAWDMGPYRFTDWTSGAHDAYLQTIGQQARAFGRTLYVRPWPEMNGDWQPFMPDATGSRPYGGTPSQFIDAWRYVVTKVRAAGGTNIKWVFNPYAATYTGTADVTTLWPGANYVDVLGMDGYNWGGGPQGSWASFNSVFAPMYKILTGLHAKKPVWICEVGSKEPLVDDGAPVDPARSKAEWIRTAFASSGFPRLAAIVAFDERKERDWRVDSSSGSLAAYQAAVAARAARR